MILVTFVCAKCGCVNDVGECRIISIVNGFGFSLIVCELLIIGHSLISVGLFFISGVIAGYVGFRALSVLFVGFNGSATIGGLFTLYLCGNISLPGIVVYYFE